MDASLHPVIVLAAGRGKRAGGPKALIDVGGQPWWKRQAARLAGAGLKSVWVVSQRVREGMGTAHSLRCASADEAAPMFASILAGVAAIRETAGSTPPRGVFVLPVDVPVPEERTFEMLVEQLQGREPACAAAPLYKGKNGHPVYVTWSFAEEEILGRKHEGEPRLDYLLEGLTLEVGVRDEAVTANLNTAEDFARWHATH